MKDAGSRTQRHTYARVRTHIQTHKHGRARIHIHTHTYARKHAHTLQSHTPRVPEHTHTHTSARTLTNSVTHTHTNTHTFTQDWLRLSVRTVLLYGCRQGPNRIHSSIGEQKDGNKQMKTAPITFLFFFIVIFLLACPAINSPLPTCKSGHHILSMYRRIRFLH